MKKLPDHLFISYCAGHMYDTRREDWPHYPLRHNYASTRAGGTVGLRAFIRRPYVFPGGYELSAITSDGAVLCAKCCKENYRSISDSTRKGISDGWQVAAIEVLWEGGTCCDQCGKNMCAYDEVNEA